MSKQTVKTRVKLRKGSLRAARSAPISFCMRGFPAMIGAIRNIRDEITAVRFYGLAHSIIGGRLGHADRGPQWSYFAGLREISKSLQRVHRGDCEPVVFEDGKP